MNTPVKIDYYTDILCIWAWVSELRVQALKQEFGDNIQITAKYIDVFGDVTHKMNTTWQAKGGFIGFSEHVQNTAKSFPEMCISPLLWTKDQPLSSAVIHTYIKAVQLITNETTAQQFALAVRQAFYINAQNISTTKVLNHIAQTLNIDTALVNECLQNGSAMAALMQDYQFVKSKSLQGSPTFILDNGRQTLFGNVSYRVLKANIESLLQTTQSDSPSWY